MNIQSVFFDMDGVVIDSEKLHLKAMALSLEKFGVDFPHSILNDFVGRSDESFFSFIYENYDKRFSPDAMQDEKNIQYELLIRNLEFIDGFQRFLKLVQSKGLKTALVTSSSNYSVRKADEILDYTSCFDVVVAEEDTQKHKPNPEPYLLALEKTGSKADATIVIEDSINGIIAGKAAGCIVIGLTTSFNARLLLQAGADYAVNSYDELIKFIS